MNNVPLNQAAQLRVTNSFTKYTTQLRNQEEGITRTKRIHTFIWPYVKYKIQRLVSVQGGKNGGHRTGEKFYEIRLVFRHFFYIIRLKN